jgi:hypothetical protein
LAGNTGGLHRRAGAGGKKPPYVPARSALLFPLPFRFFSGLIAKKANAGGGILRLLVQNMSAPEKSPIIPEQAIRELPRWASVAILARCTLCALVTGRGCLQSRLRRHPDAL